MTGEELEELLAEIFHEGGEVVGAFEWGTGTGSSHRKAADEAKAKVLTEFDDLRRQLEQAHKWARVWKRKATKERHFHNDYSRRLDELAVEITQHGMKLECNDVLLFIWHNERAEKAELKADTLKSILKAVADEYIPTGTNGNYFGRSPAERLLASNVNKVLNR